MSNDNENDKLEACEPSPRTKSFHELEPDDEPGGLMACDPALLHLVDDETLKQAVIVQVPLFPDPFSKNLKSRAADVAVGQILGGKAGDSSSEPHPPAGAEPGDAELLRSASAAVERARGFRGSLCGRLESLADEIDSGDPLQL